MSISFTAQDIRVQTIKVKDHEYQVPAGVVYAIKELEEELKKAQKKTEQAEKELAEYKSNNKEQMVERIMLNLASGHDPQLRQQSSFHAIKEKFEAEASCLAHSLDFFEKTKADQPYYEFRYEVARRISQALDGRNTRGENYR